MLDEEASDLFIQTQQNLVREYPFLNEWKVRFDSAKARAGSCRLEDKRITISYLHVENNTRDIVLDTLLHEFAHAIAFELYKEKGHGSRWKSVASEIGAIPKSRGTFSLPDSPWVLVTFCNKNQTVEKIAKRYRRNKKIKNYELKGKPDTQGQLYYVCSKQLTQFEAGSLSFDELNFTQ